MSQHEFYNTFTSTNNSLRKVLNENYKRGKKENSKKGGKKGGKGTYLIEFYKQQTFFFFFDALITMFIIKPDTGFITIVSKCLHNFSRLTIQC